MLKKSRTVCVVDLEAGALKSIERNVTEERAVVYTASAMVFDLYSHEPLFNADGTLTSAVKGYHFSLDVDEQLNLGRLTDDDTLAWWDQQSTDAILARDGALVSDIVPVGTQLKLSEFCESFASIIGECSQVFARGKEYDGCILLNMFKMMGMKDPWKYRNLHEVRTYINAKTDAEAGYIEDFTPHGGVKWPVKPGSDRPEWLISHCSFHDAL